MQSTLTLHGHGRLLLDALSPTRRAVAKNPYARYGSQNPHAYWKLETGNRKLGELVKLELSKLGKLDVLETGGVAVDARRRQRERGHRCCQYSHLAIRLARQARYMATAGVLRLRSN